MMYTTIFLLGRPGCGKSLIYQILSEKFRELGMASSCERIDDFPILKELLDQDTSFKRHVRKEGGFEVTDFSIVDEVLDKINEKIQKLKRKGNILFIEFARDHYQRALAHFSPEVMKESLLLYVYCPFEECLKRNIRRYRNRKPGDDDSHIVPEDLMRSYYRNDDYEEKYLQSAEELISSAPARLMVISTETGDIGRLTSQIEKIIEEIKREESKPDG